MNDNIILTEVYNTYKINIITDINPVDPREFDNFGKMQCFHRDYRLGDTLDFNTIEELIYFIKNPDIISLPLYLYDHSGITMKTTPFSCRWDSGQIGYIYVSKEMIRKEFNCKKITKDIMDKVYKILISEVDTYDKYLRGEVYGYEIFDSYGDFKESCWGYSDSPEDIMKEIKENVIGLFDYQLSFELQEA